MPRTAFSALILASAALAAAAPASASAASVSTGRSTGTFQIRGAGDGHGIGMSQYGAAGYADHGWNYQAILAHYYAGTTLANTANSTVTVLLNRGAAVFSGASAANGKRLSPSTRYGVVTLGSQLQLISAGRVVGTFNAPLKVTTTGSALDVIGHGQYAGSLLFYADGSSVDTVNAVDLEDYVKGVIAEEMPASWPAQALETQAVAARSYALASGAINAEYDVYSDTRSQMYGGLSAETAASNAAATATAGQVLRSSGRTIPAYFSASSGGHTESIQNVWPGESPTSYLTGVQDPYDDSNDNPYYRWTDTVSLASAAKSLAGLYRGTLQGVKVLRRGVSPRIVSAQVVGSRGASTVSGSTLEADLGTTSTWMSFTTVTATGRVRAATGSSSGSTSTTGGSRTGGTASSSAGTSASGSASSSGGSGGSGLGDEARASGRSVSGTVFPAVRGSSVAIERRGADGRWERVGTTTVTAAGAYALAVFAPGTYRALYAGAAAPAVTLG